ncbi:hypothetical protein ADL35_08360, partial [Streptomyces sp. NRRL WC-3753]
QPAQRAKNQVPRTPEPRTPNLSDRAAAKKEQVQQVLNLIENRGFDAVKLALVMDETGMAKTTAYNRLNEARDLWTKRNVA